MKHGAYRRSNLVPVSHPLFEYDWGHLTVVQARVPECAVKYRVM